MDVALLKAIELIKVDHAVGDNYDYYLLVILIEMENPLSEFKIELLSLVATLKNNLPKIDFKLDSDKDDYCESIERLKDKTNKQ